MSCEFQSTLSVRRATGTTGKLGEITIKFQSTLSVRRATIESVESRETHDISIHALRKESDLASIDDGTVRSDFNPRSP